MEQPSMTQKTIKTTNLSAILTATVAILLLALLVALSYKPLYNHFAGPFEISAEELFLYQGPNDTLRTHVTIRPDVALDTNFYYYEKQEGGSEKVIHSYYVLLFDEHLLLAKYPGTGKGDIFNPEPVTGKIVNLTDKENTEVLQTLKTEFPNLKDAFLPYVLDTTVNNSPVWFMIIGIAVVAGFAIWSVFNLIRRSCNSRQITPDVDNQMTGLVAADIESLGETDFAEPDFEQAQEKEQTNDATV